MKIIIAGSGQVGSHLAKLLSYESQEITLIDSNDEKLTFPNVGLKIITSKFAYFALRILLINS